MATDHQQWLAEAERQVADYRAAWSALVTPHLGDSDRRFEALREANARFGDPVSVLHPLLHEAISRMGTLPREAPAWDALLQFVIRHSATSREHHLLLSALDVWFRQRILSFSECEEIWARAPLAQWGAFPGFETLRLAELEASLEEALQARAEQQRDGRPES